jgi:hypothetical protein
LGLAAAAYSSAISGRAIRDRARFTEYLTRDGMAPADFNELGPRARPLRRGDEHRRVIDASGNDDHFHGSLGHAAEERSRFLLLAAGVTDDLPAIPGFDGCYGRSVFHCPYCDGWESRDRRLAVVGRGNARAGLALGLKTWSRDVVPCTKGAPRRTLGRLKRNVVRKPTLANFRTGVLCEMSSTFSVVMSGSDH